ncbi:MAG: hypothetical protein GY798_04820 [Hyphomicrobiales bacterium]|nr:hypothetical protein [Hyphomicrobiales bacterium]
MLWITFLFVLLGFPSLSFAEKVIVDPEELRYLYSFSAIDGFFVGDSLTLKSVPLVVYFSDRPARIAGHIALDNFLQIWENNADSLNKDPPNAELVVYNKSGDTQAVLIISKPTVDGDSISFAMELIDGNIPEHFGPSTLFIDDMIDPEFGLRPARSH